MNSRWKFAVALCLLVLSVYAYTAPLGRLESLCLDPADTYYNSLVQGFRAHQLSLKKEVPPGLEQLPDPYDPAANSIYQDVVRDLSYYKGKLYTYFGVTPVLILLWPFTTVTGKYLSDRQAVATFCAVGIVVSLGLLRALWRRYFAEVSVWVVIACGVALGFATWIPTIIPRSQVHEVASSCGYMLTMVALAAIWCALHKRERRCWWLAAASLAYGLAVGSRPSLVFGAIILLVPVMQTRREGHPVWAALIAALGPIVAVGLGLMLYNMLRFGNPFEFGWRYQLGGKRQVLMEFLSPRYLWFNFQVYFLAPARWFAHFPFVHEPATPPLPPGYYGGSSYGILTNVPIVWLALAAPLVWRSRLAQPNSSLRWFIIANLLLFGVCALTIGLYCFSDIRYAVDFLPALLLVAVIGIFGLERALADRPAMRRAARCGWGVLLGFSVILNLLVSIANYGHTASGLAAVLALDGRVSEATEAFKTSLRLLPDDADGHAKFGFFLLQQGKVEEAISEYEQTLRINPDSAGAHNDLGNMCMQQGKISDAVRHFEEASRLNPNYFGAHYNLALALAKIGRTQEAVAQLEQSLRLSPNFTPAKDALTALQSRN